jgi:hypothetical protein
MDAIFDDRVKLTLKGFDVALEYVLNDRSRLKPKP